MQRSFAWSLSIAAFSCGAGDAALTAQAASDLRCGASEVATTSVGHLVERASCGGRELLYYGNEERWISPLDKAVFELECPRRELLVKVLDDQTVGVSGCGNKAVYVLSDDTKRTWVSNLPPAGLSGK
jgi:hypothetical protein